MGLLCFILAEDIPPTEHIPFSSKAFRVIPQSDPTGLLMKR